MGDTENEIPDDADIADEDTGPEVIDRPHDAKPWNGEPIKIKGVEFNPNDKENHNKWGGKIADAVIISMIYKTYGNLAACAKLLGVKSRFALERRIKRSKKLTLAMYDARAMLVDIAEQMNLKALLKGDPKAIDRTLRSFGRDRGWIYPEHKIAIQNNNENNQNTPTTVTLSVQDIIKISKDRTEEFRKKYGIDPPESLKIQESLIQDLIKADSHLSNLDKTPPKEGA
jgi:hypothetical protein